MNYIEMKRFLPSRMEGTEADNTNIRKETTVPDRIRTVTRIGRLSLLLGVAALIYYLFGYMLQHIDPTAGWLDIGTLSLPLFAAWSCLLGTGIAGLLPVIMGTIGRKGGITKWKADRNPLWQATIYIGYIALLCALL